jgi:REP element-mobilizing transposase RayT
MSRPIRLEFSGALFHVTSRGDGREAIVLSDDDRAMWLQILGEVCERFSWVCHAWCLMTNHYHLLIETPEGNLSAGMRQLNGVYTQRFNHAHHRVGHVFQGRFKAILVERESYLLELARYIVLNPVRAHMVEDVDQWRWSSYAATVGTEPAPAWLEVKGLLVAFSARRRQAIERYITFVRDGQKQSSPWSKLRAQVYLGGEDFLAEMQQEIEQTKTSPEIPHTQRRPVAADLADYVAQAHDRTSRNAAIARAYASGDYSMQAIADAFGLHYSTVSRAVTGQK